MKKFCTNCGQENDQENQVCVECGQSFSGKPQESSPSEAARAPNPRKEKQPLSMKTKIIGVASLLLIASLVGIYSWGTNAASADTAVSTFFEALQNEDAEALAKKASLSNGEAMTVKQAEVFIAEYQGLTPAQLDGVASVEQNGKVMGIFNAHRVIVPVQELAFYFPHEGLSLRLNGEVTEGSQNSTGDYVFSGITPGNHQAEFAYKGEFVEFTHPFDLLVPLSPTYSQPIAIREDLPVSSVIFTLNTFMTDAPDAHKVMIGEQEIPVNDSQQTEEIGPLLLDGSTSAYAQVEFPWGTETSEPVNITSNYHSIEFVGMDEKHQQALTDQLMVFAEEYVEAHAKRDAAVFTSVSSEQLDRFKQDIDWMTTMGDHFMGALTEVGVDEESIAIMGDGKTVTLDAEMLIDGDNYYKSETPNAEEIKKEVSLNFVYDEAEEKWMVSTYNEGGWMFDAVPTATFEGSGTVHESESSAAEEEAEKEDESESEESEEAPEEEVAAAETAGSVTEEQLEQFIADFRAAYETALNEKDFSRIDAFLKADSIARQELVDFIADTGSEDYLYEFLVDEAVGVEILEDKAFVETNEEFDFTNHLDEVINYKRNKKYEVHGVESGDLKIAGIDIMDTTRE